MSEQSESVAAIGSALAKAQGEIQPAAKDSVNPHFRSKYADLASVWDACRSALSKNGIAVVQRVARCETGVRVSTQLTHSSGEWMRDSLELPVVKSDPQGYGSAITYARRYGLAAMVGVAPDEDDDAESAVGRGEQQSSQRPAQQPTQKAPQQQPPKRPTTPKPEEVALRARAVKVWERAKAHGWNAQAFAEWAAKVLGVKKPSASWTADDVGKLESAWTATQEPPAQQAKPAEVVNFPAPSGAATQ